MGDGYFLLFPSLSKGKHTIHYGGTFHFEPGELADEALDFPKDITTELTVAKTASTTKLTIITVMATIMAMTDEE